MGKNLKRVYGILGILAFVLVIAVVAFFKLHKEEVKVNRTVPVSQAKENHSAKTEEIEKLNEQEKSLEVTLNKKTPKGLKELSDKDYRLYHDSEKLTKEKLDSLGLEKCDKLMLVAHPDDETLWGGAHIIEGNYFVVCFTHGKEDDIRYKEFHKVLNAEGENGSKGFMLNHPDKVNEERSNWRYIEDEVEDDIRCLLNYKKWKCIVTHNPEGEYGHQHHKALNKLTTKVYNEDNIVGSLYFFGKYFDRNHKDQLERNNYRKIKSSTLAKKERILKYYVSQTHGERNSLKRGHGQMFPYENFKEYKK